MSTDIVVLLREGVFGGKITKTDVVLNGIMHEAALEIERLREELAKMRSAHSSWNGCVDRQSGAFEPHEYPVWR